MSLVIGEVFRFKPNPALFDVYVQDFGDDYHRDSFPEEEREVRKIKGGKYRDLDKYLHDKEIYDEYMDKIKSRYPKKLYKKLIKSGELGLYIPNKPWYQPKSYEKILKAAYDHDIYISKSGDLEMDLADEYMEEFWKEQEDIDIDSESLLKVSKEDRKLVDKIVDDEYFERTGYIDKKKKKKKLNDVDLLEELYLINSVYDKKDKKKKKHSKKKKNRVGIPLHRYISGEYLKDIEKEEKRELNTISYMNGMLMSGKDKKMMEIYDLMVKGGHKNIYRLMKQRKSKEAKRMSKIYKKQQHLARSKENFNSILEVALNDTGSNYDDFLADISRMYNS